MGPRRTGDRTVSFPMTAMAQEIFANSFLKNYIATEEKQMGFRFIL
jgi:hypothetical protein